MPTNRARFRPGRHSVSSGEASSHPPANTHADKSTSDVSDASSRVRRVPGRNLSNAAGEQAGIATLRDVADFLRETEPPPSRPLSHDTIPGPPSCREQRRWSLQSLRRNMQMKPQSHSLQMHLPKHAVPGTTVEREPLNATSSPISENGNTTSSLFRPQYPMFSPAPATTAGPGELSGKRPWKLASLSNTDDRTVSRDPRGSPRLFQHANMENLSTVPDGDLPRLSESEAPPTMSDPSPTRGQLDNAMSLKSAQKAACIAEPDSKPELPPKSIHRPRIQDAVLAPDEQDQGFKGHHGSTEAYWEEAPLRNGHDEFERQSLASLPTTTLDCQQSTFTYSSDRSSSATDMSIQSTAVTIQKNFDGAGRVPGKPELPTTEACGNGQGNGTRNSAAYTGEVRLADVCDPSLDKKHDQFRRRSSCLSMASDSKLEASLYHRTMLNWRMARKAKVHEYKLRDLNASQLEAADSAASGHPSPAIPEAIPKGFSAPSRNGRRPSTLNVTATSTDGATNENLHQTADVKVPPETRHHFHLNNASSRHQAKVNTDTELNISSVIATEIEPVPAPNWHACENTMSPIMVVADIESRPGSPSLQLTTRTRPESFMPRTMLRPMPLKVNPLARPKSHTVTLSRNPSTGMIERSTIPALDSQLNRRSLMTMPTPPLSPEAMHFSKRLSLPPVQLHLPIAVKGRLSPLRRQGWRFTPPDGTEPESDAESEPEPEQQQPGSRLRSATLRERVMREKIQKEKEIMDIVAKTVGLPQKRTGSDDEPNPVPLEQNNAETLEKRLRRLERNNDAWLCAMKPLLEAMARTLDDMREDDKSGSLKMSDFIVDTEVEAGQANRGLRGKREIAPARFRSLGEVEPNRPKPENRLEPFGPTSIASIPQEADNSSLLQNEVEPTTATGKSASPEEAITTSFRGAMHASSTLPMLDTGASEVNGDQMPQQEIMSRLTVRCPSTASLHAPESHDDDIHGDRSIHPSKLYADLKCSVDNLPNDSEVASLKSSSKEVCTDSDAIETLAARRELTGNVELGSLAEPKEPNDWSDVDPLIWELGSMSRKSKVFAVMNHQPADGNGGALSPIMQELMNGSKLWAEEVEKGS